MSTQDFYHEPVLKEEVVQLLVTDPNGIYLDCTLGGGGHFGAIAKKLESAATLIGIDRDPDAIEWNRQHKLDVNFQMIFELSRFSDFDAVLRNHAISHIDGALLDLGVSSWQIDNKDRGFSYMGEGILDMRMNRREGITADEFIHDVSESELTEVLAQYGEVQNAGRMAKTLKNYKHPLKTSADMRACLEQEYGPNIKYKVLSKVFQALRIAINDELGELKRFLGKITQYLKPHGRVAIMSYHSLEDRIVKEYFRSSEQPCICPKEVPVCICGKVATLKRITKKSIQAGDDEIKMNPRSRSVRLRVAEKIAE